MKRQTQKPQGGAKRRGSFWRRGTGSALRRPTRPLRAESLEERRLLAADFHNLIYPPDVNADGRATIADLLGVVGALRNGGPRQLAAGNPTAEGEDGAPNAPKLYIDVNGDNFLSLKDALDVIRELRGEGEAQARDDSFTPGNPPSGPFAVTSNTTNNPLPVLDNDSGTGSLTITRVGTLQAGLAGNTTTSEFGGTVTIQGSGANNTLVYTPAPDFFGQDRFIYEIRDNGETDPARQLDTAVVTVFVNPAPGDVFVRFTYRIVSPANRTNPTAPTLAQVENGERFVVQAFVQDTRNGVPAADRGVSAAALDLDYNSTIATLLPVSPPNDQGFSRDFLFADNYLLLPSVAQFLEPGTPDEINEISSAQSDLLDPNLADPLGPNPVLFFTAQFQASQIGTIMFVGNPADVATNQIVFLEPGQLDAVPPSAVNYGSVSLQVIAPTGAVADIFTRNEDLAPGANPELSNPILPVLANDTIVNNPGLPFVGNITAISVGGQTVTQTGVPLTLPSGSQIRINANRQDLTYTPALNFFGSEAFTYTVQDANNATDSATVTINVNPVNDPPDAVDDLNLGPFVENGPQVVLNVLANDSDPDNDPITITGLGPNRVTTLNLPTGGVVTIGPNGQNLLYTPGSSPGETFTYTISDGLLTDTATVSTIVQRFDQAAEILVSVTDLNGNPLPTVGGRPQLNVGQQFRVVVGVQDLRPADEAQLGLGLFSAFIDLLYTAQFIDFVGPVNFGPNYNNPEFRSPGNASVDGIINEVGSPQTDLFSGPVGAGPFTLFTVTLRAEQFGTATITADPPDLPGNEIQLFDPPTILAPADVRFGSVTVNIVNPGAQQPTANNDSYAVAGGTQLQITTRPQGVLGNDIDPEGDNTIQAVLTTPPTNGTLVLNPNGTFTYTPAAGFIGTDTFRYQATDGGPLSNIATVTIVVGVNVVNDLLTGNVGQTITGNVLANDALPPNSVVTAVNGNTGAVGTNLVLPSGATVRVNANGAVTYTPLPGLAYTDTFTYTAGGQTATVTVRVGAPAAPLRGFVFTDEDNNLQKNLVNGEIRPNGERGLGGVTVTLRNTATGATLTTKTAADGSYSFPTAPAGQYTLTAEQPAFMIGGWNVINGNLNNVTASDSIAVTLGGVPQKVDFTERGLRAEFVSPRDFFGQADRNGFQIATTAGAALGSEHWFSFLDGYAGYTKAEASVNSDGTRATIRLTRNDGQVFTLTNVAVGVNSRVRLMGRMGNGVVLRFEGTPTQFIASGATASQGAGEGEAESHAGAVDAVFSNGWNG